MSVPKKRKEIREQLIGNQNKRALLVEGVNDEMAFRILLSRYANDWEQRWVLAVAGNKRQLLEILMLEPQWAGIVDRDEWDQETIDEKARTQPNVHVLPRFCLENYLIPPKEVWQAIPADQKTLVDGGADVFTQALQADLPKYLRHGVLWKVISPLWTGLRARGFKEALASRDSVETAQDDAKIQRTLGEWDTLLDPVQIFEKFQQQFNQASLSTVEKQLALLVHGKVFWENVVNPVMNRMFGQMSEDDRRKHILRGLSQPSDLKSIFNLFR